jgi:signal peptidase I
MLITRPWRRGAARPGRMRACGRGAGYRGGPASGSALGLIATALLAIAVLTRWVRGHLRIVSVTGASMLPAYRNGDLLVIRRVPPRAIRPGDVVVLDTGLRGQRRPDVSHWIIKRVAAVPGDAVAPGLVPGDQDATVPAGQYVLLGDNPARSTDSRQHGYFPANRIIGRVVGTGTRNRAPSGRTRGYTTPAPGTRSARRPRRELTPGKRRPAN